MSLKRRNLLSLVIALPIVVGISRLYRPYLDTRLGATIDLVFVVALFFCIRAVFAKFESDD
jgi:hypothetical protein